MLHVAILNSGDKINQKYLFIEEGILWTFGVHRAPFIMPHKNYTDQCPYGSPSMVPHHIDYYLAKYSRFKINIYKWSMAKYVFFGYFQRVLKIWTKSIFLKKSALPSKPYFHS